MPVKLEDLEVGQHVVIDSNPKEWPHYYYGRTMSFIKETDPDIDEGVCGTFELMELNPQGQIHRYRIRWPLAHCSPLLVKKQKPKFDWLASIRDACLN